MQDFDLSCDSCNQQHFPDVCFQAYTTGYQWQQVFLLIIKYSKKVVITKKSFIFFSKIYLIALLRCA